jgi:hypothetical protein
MTSRFHVTILAGLFSALLLAGTAHAQNPVVKTASVQVSTGEDGKDDSTSLTVTITNPSGKIFERVFDDKRKAQPDTSSTFWLTRVRPETADKLKGSHITFTILPKGDDRWTIKDARLKVNFATGPSKIWRFGAFTLEASDSKPVSVDFVLADEGH